MDETSPTRDSLRTLQVKTPKQLRDQLRRQWLSGATREQRLLDTGQWPQRLSIGKPPARVAQHEPGRLREHIDGWRQVAVGRVDWQPVGYRSLAEPVDLPLAWELATPAEWIEATGDAGIRREFGLLSSVLSNTGERYHAVVVRQRQLLLSRGADEVIQACVVADALEPGCAGGRPLRALSMAGCDSKFFERNCALLLRLLALRFGDAVADQGLEAFLGAADEGDHWLLIAPLDAGLLPFEQLRLRSSELRRAPIAGTHLVVVENERSLYQLPRLPGTVAVLGSGLNLGWMAAAWLSDRRLAYWGDLDTWGLSMLATARKYQPHLTALLMDEVTYQEFAPGHAVAEPIKAGEQPPAELRAPERELYRILYARRDGRVEQEFIAAGRVHRAVRQWRQGR